MTLLVREVVSFVLAAAAWLLLALGIVVPPAFLGSQLSGRPLTTTIPIGLAGAAIAASLAVRFDAPQAWAPLLGSRPLPVAWSAAGAIAAVGALVLRDLPRSGPDD